MTSPVPAARVRVHSRTAEVVSVVLFVTVMAAANLVIAHYGPWLLPATAFISLGVSMVCRDYLHDVWYAGENSRVFWTRMILLVVAAGAISWLINPDAGRVALASTVAIAGGAALDTAAFAALFRFKWLVRSNGSNVAGSLGDSILFPLVAFGVAGVGGWGPFALLVLAQAGTKWAGGLFWSLVFRVTLNPDARRRERARARREATGAAAA